MAKKMTEKKMMAEMNKMKDMELIRKFQAGDKDAGAEFLNNHYAEIVKVARYHAYGTKYDYELGSEINDDCISEAVLAAYDAMAGFDFKRSNIMTFINTKIGSYFMTLKRNNSRHSERYAAMSRLSGSENLKDREINVDELLESQVDLDAFEKDEHDREMKMCVDQVLNCFDRDSVEWTVTRLYYNALTCGMSDVINFVCGVTGYTRQGVYNVLKRTAHILPGDMASDIRSVLLAA